MPVTFIGYCSKISFLWLPKSLFCFFFFYLNVFLISLTTNYSYARTIILFEQLLYLSYCVWREQSCALYTFILLNKPVFWCPLLERVHSSLYYSNRGVFAIFPAWLWVNRTILSIVDDESSVHDNSSLHMQIYLSWCTQELPSPFSSYNSLLMPCNPIIDSKPSSLRVLG